MSLVFRDTILTNKGFEVSNKAALGKTQFSIVKAVSTDVDLTNYKIEDLKNLTSLPNEIESGSILDYDSPQNSISVIKINFDNSKFRDGYTVRAVGLYGKDNNGDVFLHSLSVSESPIVVPQVTGNVFDGLSHSIAIFSGDNKNMTVNLVQSGYATIHYVDDSISKLSDDIQNIIKPSLDQKADKIEVAEGMDNLSNQSKQGFDNLGGMLKPLLDINEIKQDVSNRFANYNKGLKDKQDNVDLSVKDNKLYYAGTPVLTATTPNQPKINVKLNGDTGNLAYQITPPDMDGGASITNYVISYRIITDENWKTIQVNGTTFNGEIAGIQKGQTYQVKVTATNMAGKSVDSETQQILAANEPSGVSIEVSNDYPNGVKYNINVSNNGGLDKIYYQIFYKKDTDNLWQFIDHPAKSGNLSNINIFNDNYQFKAKAGNFIGTSLESKTISSLFDEEKISFDMPKAYTGKHYDLYGQTGIINSNEKPIFNFKKDVTNAIIEINFESFKYFYGTGNQFVSTPTYASIMQPKVIIYPNEFSSDETVQLIPKMDIYAKKNGGFSNTNFSLKLKRESNSLTFINGYNEEGEDLNIQSTGTEDGGNDIPCLNSIKIKYIKGLSND